MKFHEISGAEISIADFSTRIPQIEPGFPTHATTATLQLGIAGPATDTRGYHTWVVLPTTTPPGRSGGHAATAWVMNHRLCGSRRDRWGIARARIGSIAVTRLEMSRHHGAHAAPPPPGAGFRALSQQEASPPPIQLATALRRGVSGHNRSPRRQRTIPRIAGSADGEPVVIHSPPLSRPDGLPAALAVQLVLAPSLRRSAR